MIFISSPYSHERKEVMHWRYVLASKYAAHLIANGQVAFSPITYGHTILQFKDLPKTWEFWEGFCAKFLENASEMHVLKIAGYKESRGVKAEIAMAGEMGIPIRYVEPVDPPIRNV
jgi:hypothetical protein